MLYLMGLVVLVLLLMRCPRPSDAIHAQVATAAAAVHGGRCLSAAEKVPESGVVVAVIRGHEAPWGMCHITTMPAAPRYGRGVGRIPVPGGGTVSSLHSYAVQSHSPTYQFDMDSRHGAWGSAWSIHIV